MRRFVAAPLRRRTANNFNTAVAWRKTSFARCVSVESVSWQHEIQYVGLVRMTAETLPHAVRDALERTKRNMTKTILRGDSSAIFALLDDLQITLSSFDPPAAGDLSELDCHFNAWGSFLNLDSAKRPVHLLISLLQNDDLEVTALAAGILSRTLQWLPEYMNELLDSHQILEATARYVYKTQKEASEEGKKAFLAAITLLSVVVKAAAGLQKTSILREVAVVHPILRWWRRVSSPEFEGARRELPKSAVTFNRLLYDLVTCDAALLTEIRAEDFALIEASFLRAGPRDSEALQKFRENDAIRVAARIILFLYSAEDFRVITSLADAKWVYKLARVVRPATWNSRRTFNVNGALVSSILRGACAFSNRWSVQVAQAELPKIAVDKLRLSLGFTMLAIREKMASKKEMVQQAEPVIEACIMFLGEFARGELTEQQYAASAYNSERVGVLRHSRLVGMLSHALRLYPSSENMAADIVSILLVLLRYEEQIYDIRDSNMVQSLTIARSHMPNATAQTRILRILKVIQEQMPM